MVSIKWIEGDNNSMKKAEEIINASPESQEVVSKYCDIFRILLRYTECKNSLITKEKTKSNVSMNEIIEMLKDTCEKKVLAKAEEYSRQFSYKFAPYLIFDSDRKFTCHLVDAFKIVWSLMELEILNHKETNISIGQNLEEDSNEQIQRMRNIISIDWEDTFIRLKLDSGISSCDAVDVDIEKKHWIESDEKASELEKMMYFALLRCGYTSSDRKSFQKRQSEIDEIRTTLTDYIWKENQKLMQMQQVFRITTLSQCRSSMITQQGLQLKILLEPKVIKYIMNREYRINRIDNEKHSIELTVYEQDKTGHGVCGVYISREYMILSDNGLYNKVNIDAFG